MTEHKANGTFDGIAAEVERRRMLGQIGSVPFLRAYLAVGQELHQRNASPLPGTGGNSLPGSQTQGQVIETRVAAPKAPSVANGDKARAASPTKTASKAKTVPDFNPLAVSDEEFEKHAAMMKWT